MIAVEQQVESVGKYHRYGQYVSSGYAYLPEVPVHWKILRNRQLFHFKKRPVGKRAHQYQLLSLTLKGIIPRDIESGKGKIPAEFDTYQVVEPNNIVFCLFDIDETPRTVGLSSQNGMVTGAYAVAEVAKEHCPEFVYYYYLHLDEFKGLRPFYTGLRKVVRPETFMGLSVPTPPQEEQRTIAAFLDYETARIDRLIAQQQRLIELLKEKRQAVISHAVTKGLNPTATMKDSGVEWLGQVPEHWQCVPFGLLVSRADLGGNYLGGQEENGIPFLKMGNLGRGCIVLDKLECLEEGSSFDDAHRLSMGDFLFNTRNSLDLVGKVAVWHDELEFALYNSNLLRVRFKKDFVSSPDFMGFVFNSSGALGWLALLAKGTTSVAAIYYKDLRSMVVPIPPVDEQNAISSFISKCLSRLDTLEKKAIQSINLMNERRTALISAAVTGKIDLRGWTPPADEVAA